MRKRGFIKIAGVALLALFVSACAALKADKMAKTAADVAGEVRATAAFVCAALVR